MFKLRFEKWSDIVKPDHSIGTIRTIPENYYVATVLNDYTLEFEGIESMTRNINKNRVTSWFNKIERN